MLRLHVLLAVVVALYATLALSDACDDSYLLPTNSASPSTVLSVAAINGILTEHNNARRNVQPPAQVMPMLRWNQTLADFAQEYMDTCVGIVHSSNAQRTNPSRFGFSYVGENLAAGGSSAYLVTTGGAQSTRAWNSEITDYTYANNSCRPNRACGHYTQNIWATTTHVGCGYARCESLPFKNYWSCVYGPGGNFVGQKPYVEATASTPVAICQNLTGVSGFTHSPGTVPPAPTGASNASGTTQTPGGAANTTAAPGPTAATTAAPGGSPATTASPAGGAASTAAPGGSSSTTAAPAAGSPATSSPPVAIPSNVLSTSHLLRLSGSHWAALLANASTSAGFTSNLRTALESDIRNRCIAANSSVAIGRSLSIVVSWMGPGSLYVRFSAITNYPATGANNWTVFDEVRRTVETALIASGSAYLGQTIAVYAAASVQAGYIATATDVDLVATTTITTDSAAGGELDGSGGCGTACITALAAGGVVFVVAIIVVIMLCCPCLKQEPVPTKKPSNDPTVI